MKYRKLLYFLQNIGKDPDTLVFEDELTGFGNRRLLHRFFENEIDGRNLRNQPLCLLMVGIDDLEQINGKYGRNVGDEVIVHAAGIMKPLATEKDLLIRYGAGELILLLPGKDKPGGIKIAESLVSAFQENPFFSSEAGMPIPVSMAIGAACAPDDADYGNMLVNRADTALYHAKKSGNGSIVDASDAGRLAIRHIHSAGIVGRKPQFDIVSAGFKDLKKGKNQFFIIDGEPGMGKTSFIDAVKRNLEKTRLKPIRVNGLVQESYRPYYLISYVILALMNRREDKGIEIIESTGKEDLACLLHIIPQLTDEKIQAAPGDFPVNPKTVFNALNRFFFQLAEKQTLVLLIDDFDMADPASLNMLYELMTSGNASLFICAAASSGEKERSSAIPLTLFRTAYSEELDIKNIFLNPLTPVDIKKYINLIFPGINLPQGLGEELARITGGYPLFLVAIIIKMIEDRKILQSENRWTVVELESGYFPGSFEQILREKLDNLGTRDKEFIDRVSAFGESASLSMLEGFTKQESHQVYEIIKEAVNHGLMRHEFRDNDENIRFSSKLVREVIYERIGEEERKKLHEEIGRYHEKLYFQDVLPSVAPLVHHFSQSDNLEKAHTYEQLMAKYNKDVYEEPAPEQDLADAEDAAEGWDLAVSPLSEQGRALVPEMLHALVVSIRNVRLYPEKSKSVTSMTGRLMFLVQEILKTNDCFSLVAEKNLLLVNSQPANTASMPVVAATILERWNRLELKSLTIKKGVTEKEMLAVVRQISNVGNKAVTPKFWKQFAEENDLAHILPSQVRYTKVGTGRTGAEEVSDISPDAPIESLAPLTEHQFTTEEKKAIQRIIGSLLSAYKKIKLYPSRGHVATKAVYQVVTELHAFLTTWPVFTVARIDDRLLVNGVKIDTTEFESLADGFLKILAETGLNSISFTGEVSANEVIDFIKAACRMPADGTEGDFWRKLAAQKQINGILFNQSIYDILPAARGEEDAPLTEDEANTTGRDQTAYKLAIEDIPARARERYLKGDIRGLEAILQKTVEMYLDSGARDRLTFTDIFHRLLFPKDWHPNAAYIKRVANHTVALLETEESARPLEQLFDLCHECTRTFILFGEYPLASWMYTATAARFTAVYPDSAASSPLTRDAADIHVLGRPLGQGVKEAITEDLHSGERARQQEVVQLLSEMGPCMIPFLIDLIMESKNLRTRRLGAELLRKQEKAGGEMLKNALLKAWRPEQKSRILDVIDTVTTDLADELAHVFSDPDDNVRRSAFKLIERLNTTEALALAENAARSGDTRLSLPAINTLVKLKPDSLVQILSSILRESDDPEILVISCRAMGQTGDAAYIEPLAEILFPKRRLFRRKKYDAPVRVAAAFAAAQIPGEKAASVMARLKKDPDERIRQVVNRYDPQ
ncbi:MAG: diguanylate cyclase [Thermodesulfobacteriota bacterium]